MEAIDFLEELLNIYSPSFSEEEISSFLCERLQNWGFTSFQDNIGNVIAYTGDGNPEILFLGHIDTVKGMIPVRRENGKIYGRGAVDAKGALAAFVWAAKEIKDSIGKEIGIIGAVEEEVSSSAGARNIVGEFNPVLQ